MVFEQLYSAGWIEKKARYAFLMGVGYSVLGIASALILFPSNPGLAAIAFTSLLIVPSLNTLLSLEENEAARENKFNVFLLFKDHKDIFQIYFFLFLGIIVSFAFFSLVWPSIATSQIFAQQAAMIGPTGGAAYHGMFKTILGNNLKVLIVCLIASLVYGAGAIFIITWNASVWGVVFALIAKNSALAAGQNPYAAFALMILSVLPHMLLEASAYFLAAISGGIFSKALLREKTFSKRFNQIIEDSLMMFIIAVIVLVLACWLEVAVAGRVFGLLSGLF